MLSVSPRQSAIRSAAQDDQASNAASIKVVWHSTVVAAAGNASLLALHASDNSPPVVEPRQHVIIPDSEESPGRCSQPREARQYSSQLPAKPLTSPGARLQVAVVGSMPMQPAFNTGLAGAGELQEMHHTVSVSIDGAHDVAEQQGLDQQPHQVSSGCSLEALPGHSPAELCTQQSLEQQQQQQQMTPASDDGPSREAAPQLASSCADLLQFSAAAHGVGRLSLPQPQQAARGCQLAPPSAFGTPTAPAPAGPCEHAGDEVVPAAAANDQVGDVSVPGQGTSPMAKAVQIPQKGRLLEGSQPSSSSLKRVPETPDSAENRSQPTQSPVGVLPQDTSLPFAWRQATLSVLHFFWL